MDIYAEMTFIQSSLFELEAVPSPCIEGLAYQPDFIGNNEEEELLEKIDQQPWMNDLKRRVQHYGYRYDYSGKHLSKDSSLGKMPDWLRTYCELLSQQGHFLHQPDQVIINEYQPGQGISPHIDKVDSFGEHIGIISLGSACVMEFAHAISAEKKSLLLEPRSLLLLSGEARYQWKHSIPARKTDSYNGMKISRNRRVSMTFRNVVTD